MANRKTKSTSTIPRRDTVIQHRRPRVSAGRVIAFSMSGIGDRLYYLGATIERNRKNLWRSFKKSTKALFAGLFGIFGFIFGGLGRLIAGVWNDITMPFRKIRKSFKSLNTVVKSTKGRGFGYRMNRVRLFFKYGWLWNKHLVSRMMNYVVPALSLVLCITVLSSMLNLNYALRVSYNGQTVGYIADESVYDSARRIIQSRMIAGSDQDILRDDTELSIAVVPSSELSSQDIMAESLLSVSGSEIADATGIFIGGVLYGATTAPAVLEAKLEELKAPYYEVAAQLGEGTTVRFARDVWLEEGIYPASSVKPVEELIAAITSSTPTDIYYTAIGGESVSDVALMNGITTGMLRDMNPSIQGVNFLESGTILLVARDELLLRVKTVKHVVDLQPVAYETTLIRDSKYDIQYALVVQDGVMGERTIVKEVEYDAEGNVVLENIISDEITTPPVNQEIVTGTQSADIASVSGTDLAWPTSPGYFVSRGWIAGVHFAIDIAAAYGTNIYAADAGTVIEKVYSTYGYGYYIRIQHDNGWQTLYAHNSALLVDVGDRVQRGQLIALMGSTGNSTGPHLHFEVIINGIKVPPEPYIGWV